LIGGYTYRNARHCGGCATVEITNPGGVRLTAGDGMTRCLPTTA
jgi:hypothetical protein